MENIIKILETASLMRDYNQLFLQLKRLCDEENGDKKEAHRLQDIIYRKFIQDICNNRLESLEYIKVISSQINENVITYDIDHEY